MLASLYRDDVMSIEFCYCVVGFAARLACVSTVWHVCDYC